MGMYCKRERDREHTHSCTRLTLKRQQQKNLYDFAKAILKSPALNPTEIIAVHRPIWKNILKNIEIKKLSHNRADIRKCEEFK